MADFSGLQIDVRCIKCGRPPTADVTLYEMQNHLYICSECRQKAESSGKHIKWVTSMGAEMPKTEMSLSPDPRMRGAKSTVPPNSIFAHLGLPLTASSDDIETAIAQRMRLLLREEDSPERTQKIEQLHEWQETVEDPERLEAYRASLQPGKNAGQALSVGGRLVYTLEEFLNACEESREGWADGERYLRTGQLQYWIIYQIENRDLASAILFFQNNLKEISTFRAFNQVLYCLVSARPFRFYSQDAWQPLTTIFSASTIEEATRECDRQWHLGEHHLYEGSLCYWLEHSRKVHGLIEYYKTAAARYANTGHDRGIGLELILERASPTLEKPHLVITFDGTEGEYTLEHWDREIPHLPIQLKITNTTRGFAKVHMELEPSISVTAPPWLVLNNNAPIDIAGTPGDGSMPATRRIVLEKLPLLNRGSKYQRSLTMRVAGAYGEPQQPQKFPITLETMSFFRGFRGRLWRFGLRGGFVGFAWNFVVGTLLAFLLYLLLRALVPTAYPAINDLSFNSFMQIALAGVIDLFRPLGSSPYALGIPFPLLVGAIMGVAGFSTGYGKGHANYTEKESASTFRQWTFWLSVIFVLLLLLLNQGGTSLVQALNIPSISNTIDAFYFTGRDIVVGILTFILGCIIATLRYRGEKFLRNHYKDLLNPPGRA
ncbi:MAG: hypothetical protein NVS4B7_17580 [Ktedonobacteraceae bacterium]